MDRTKNLAGLIALTLILVGCGPKPVLVVGLMLHSGILVTINIPIFG